MSQDTKPVQIHKDVHEKLKWIKFKTNKNHIDIIREGVDIIYKREKEKIKKKENNVWNIVRFRFKYKTKKGAVA